MNDGGDLYTLALVKGGERYVLVYRGALWREALRTLGRWAGDPAVSFTWYDAAVLSQKIREHQQSGGPPCPKN